MTRRNLFGYALLCTALSFALTLPSSSTGQDKDAESIKIGMVKTFFNDLPEVVVDIVTKPFPELIKKNVGLDGTLSYKEDAFGTAAQLDANEIQFGVFNGHEFAWLQKKYPAFRPLVVVVNPHDEVKAYVVVHKNSKAATLKDLRGKKFDMPKLTKQHCRVYVEQNCIDNAQPNPNAFFGQIVNSESPLMGMDDVCLGKADAVVIDTIELESYKDIKEFVYKNNLRILQQSEAFPPAVIVYKDGGVKDATLKQFRAGLFASNNGPNQDLFKLWHIKAFEELPKNFDTTLAATLKAYPAPVQALKVGMR